MKIAQYTINAGGYIHICECDDWREKDSGYVRLSEIVDVTFPPLPPAVVVPRQLASLESEEKELTSMYLGKLASLQSRRKDLLALAPPTLVEQAS